jgi:hypothetical protein
MPVQLYGDDSASILRNFLKNIITVPKYSSELTVLLAAVKSIGDIPSPNPCLVVIGSVLTRECGQ